MNTPTPDYSESWPQSRITACVLACAGMADPEKEIAAMREAIREAHTALDGCLKYMLGASVCNLDLECETMDYAHHALAKLQPFIQ